MEYKLIFSDSFEQFNQDVTTALLSGWSLVGNAFAVNVTSEKSTYPQFGQPVIRYQQTDENSRAAGRQQRNITIPKTDVRKLI